ncbi:MAG: serine protease [Halobacteriovoraceae bacterium]|nr:serine protease [Halobacteriovoraceae bacterium]
MIMTIFDFKKFFKISLILSCLMLGYSCGKPQLAQEEDTTFSSSEVISIRPQKRSKSVQLFKLSSPPLLTVSKKDNGVIRIDERSKETLLKEQDAFLKAVKEIDPEVKVIYKYRMVLNAFALLVDPETQSKLSKLPYIKSSEKEGRFARAFINKTVNPQEGDDSENKFLNLKDKNSVRFINAHKVHENLKVTNSDGEEKAVRGQGMKVGIIDSGIDYTHSMLGGRGTIEAYKEVDPSLPSDQFPNQKVVGGIDLVGSAYNLSSSNPENRVPQPDQNPIDESGHGTHVAGTVAGIGDGTKTYSGVAPDASLHAIKVFGKSGSTGDTVVIAGLEYAADPNGDLNLDDQLDVVNLSLGGGFGEPHSLYREAVKNLVEGGTVVVASAGNAGHSPYIVGSPSTSDEAISVAASVDDMTHNIEFEASSFTGANGFSLLVEVVQGNISRPIGSNDSDPFELVYIKDNAEADRDFTEEEALLLKDKVAVVDRGKVSFIDKLKRAFKAGAKGALVVNNKPGSPIMMGGQGKVDFPAIMVSQSHGDVIKGEMEKGSVSLQFKADKKIIKSELIDTLTNFSSRGPRSIDSLIKPEITAPGEAIVSAFVGKGDLGVAFSGTSMSGPHIAGVMALLKQYRDGLSPKELKGILMNTAKTLKSKDKKVYPVSMQGAGRVQTYKAATTPLVVLPYGLSLGNILVESKKVGVKTLEVKNISQKVKTFKFNVEAPKGLEVVLPGNVSLKPGETKKVMVKFIYEAPKGDSDFEELSGFIFLVDSETKAEVSRVPFLGISQRVSRIGVKNVLIQSTSEADSQEAMVNLTLNNSGRNKGEALIFNFLGEDERKPIKDRNRLSKSDICDLQAAGYRIVNRNVSGQDAEYLQVGFKLYRPLTTWHHCELNVQIDSNGDDKADQELVGTRNVYVPGFSKIPNGFYSLLLNANKAREIRAGFERDIADRKPKASQNYQQALEGISLMKFYEQSTVGIVEVDLSLLKRNDQGKLAIKVSALHESRSAVEMDDYLSDHKTKWYEIDPSIQAMSYRGMPETIEVLPGKTIDLSLVRGEGSEPLMALFPQNRSNLSQTVKDNQFYIPKVDYVFE